MDEVKRRKELSVAAERGAARAAAGVQHDVPLLVLAHGIQRQPVVGVVLRLWEHVEDVVSVDAEEWELLRSPERGESEAAPSPCIAAGAARAEVGGANGGCAGVTAVEDGGGEDGDAGAEDTAPSSSQRRPATAAAAAAPARSAASLQIGEGDCIDKGKESRAQKEAGEDPGHARRKCASGGDTASSVSSEPEEDEDSVADGRFSTALHVMDALLFENAGVRELAALSEAQAALFSDLAVLKLGQNLLESLPESLSMLTGIRHLDLFCNRFTVAALDSVRFDFGELRQLNVSSNPLEALPRSFRRLHALRNLVAHRCEIRKLPRWLLELRALEYLGLDGNAIAEAPHSLAAGLVARDGWLREINLDGNPCAGGERRADSEWPRWIVAERDVLVGRMTALLQVVFCPRPLCVARARGDVQHAQQAKAQQGARDAQTFGVRAGGEAGGGGSAAASASGRRSGGSPTARRSVAGTLAGAPRGARGAAGGVPAPQSGRGTARGSADGAQGVAPFVASKCWLFERRLLRFIFSFLTSSIVYHDRHDSEGREAARAR